MVEKSQYKWTWNDLWSLVACYGGVIYILVKGPRRKLMPTDGYGHSHNWYGDIGQEFQSASWQIYWLQMGSGLSAHIPDRCNGVRTTNGHPRLDVYLVRLCAVLWSVWNAIPHRVENDQATGTLKHLYNCLNLRLHPHEAFLTNFWEPS